MITRRTLLGAATGAGALVLLSGTHAQAGQRLPVSANGWPADPATIATYRVEGAAVSVALRQGAAAAVLLHVARRWHYEIAPLDTGESGGIAGHTTERAFGAAFESNHLSGTAIALHPAAHPLDGSERMWPRDVAIVRDILVDCEGAVVWGGDLRPAKLSHFHLVALPGDPALTRVATRLDPATPTEPGAQTAGGVADPAAPARRAKARALPR